MKVLGIVCSPRVQGNTEVLLQAALDKAKEAGAETELVALAGKTISPCDSCYSCSKTGKCHIKDDMQDIYTKLSEADGIIFGTPVYFWNVSAQAKALIDRTYLNLTKRDLRNKVAGVVVTAGRRGGTSAVEAFNGLLNTHRMIIAGCATGLTGPEKGEIKKDERAMSEAEALGKTMVQYIKYQKTPK